MIAFLVIRFRGALCDGAMEITFGWLRTHLEDTTRGHEIKWLSSEDQGQGGSRILATCLGRSVGNPHPSPMGVGMGTHSTQLGLGKLPGHPTN